MESWLLIYGHNSYVLRRLPVAVEAVNTEARLSLEAEMSVIQNAFDFGVKAPEIVGQLSPKDKLGKGFVMRCIDGEALPYKLFKDPNYSAAIKSLTDECSNQLAKIHAVPTEAISDELAPLATQDLIAKLEAEYRRYGALNPVYEAAFYYLKTHMPKSVEPVLLHGDFRMGNLMLGTKGITGVLDWELSHMGDPAQDIGYLCTPSWRYGNYNKTVGGFGDLDVFLDSYNHIASQPVSSKRVHYWMIYSSLWWGVCCLGMIKIWRDGDDRALERAVIGRRVSECESDLLLMLEDALSLSAPLQKWNGIKSSVKTGETHTTELIDALKDWDNDYVIPASTGRDLFQARVARNALGILSRAASLGPIYAVRQAKRRDELGLSGAKLCADLASGKILLSDIKILTHLRLTTLERLSIDQPKYAGLKAAHEKWTL